MALLFLCNAYEYLKTKKKSSPYQTKRKKKTKSEGRSTGPRQGKRRKHEYLLIIVLLKYMKYVHFNKHLDKI